jgi:predicted O-linked N-acetylglucosamine transferase (SPINDLY family)
MSTAVDRQLLQAIAAFQKGDDAGATALCEQILGAEPKRPDAWTLLGVLRKRAGRLDDAIAAYRTALVHLPTHLDAWNNLGNSLKLKNDFPGAIDAFERLLQLSPRHAPAWKELCDLLRLSNRLDEAVAAGRRALEIDPGSADAHANLGNAHASRREFAQAEAHYRHALELQPNRADFHYNFGLACQELGKRAEAEKAYKTALALDPVHVKARYNLALLYQQADRLDLAEADYLKLLELHPDHPGGCYNLAALYNAQGKLDMALARYKQCVSIDPEHLCAETEILHIQFRRCDWSGIERARRVVERLEGPNPPDSVPQPFPFLSLPFPISEATLQRIATLHAASVARGIAPLPGVMRRTIGPGDRLRIGYVSSDFHNHATAHLMLGLFRRHDRSRIEVHAYSFGPDDGSHYRQRIAADCDAFTDLHGQSAQAIARRIAADGIDIAIDLKGYTRDSLAPIFAYRPAPLQVAYLGYPGSMGAGFIDVAIVDRVVAPPSQQAFYTERLAYMPHCYQVNDSEQPIAEPMPSRAECGLPEDGFVFCCFCTHYKIEPMIFGLWMEILRQVPGSVLWLMQSHPDTMANLRREARSRGIDPDRLVFAPVMLKDRHLSRVRRADLFLDTFYYNGQPPSAMPCGPGCRC